MSPNPSHQPVATPDLTDDGAAGAPSAAAPSATSSRAAVGRAAGTVAAALALGVAGFQVALAAGVPWGEASWGGQEAVLPVGLRVASAGSVVLWAGVAAVALRQGGRDTWAPVPDRWLRRTTIGLTAYTALGVVMNLATPSAVERAIWAPTTLVLSAALGLAAAWGRPAASGPRVGGRS